MLILEHRYPSYIVNPTISTELFQSNKNGTRLAGFGYEQ